MIRTVLVFILLAKTLAAQDANTTLPNLGQAIGQGATKSVADLEARIEVLQQLTTEYTPTYTWPGYDGPRPFEALRKHLNGEVIHAERNLEKWSNRELAFVHDREHIEDVLKTGKPLPLIKDQRLRDWLRAKSPAKPLQGKWRVHRLVMHSQESCKPCKDWKAKWLGAVLADGIDYEERGPEGNSTPWFEVTYCNGDQCRTLRFMGATSYETIKNSL